MNEEVPSSKENINDCLQCAKCKKVLAKVFSSGNFEIKCPRCDTINIVEDKQISIKKFQ
ncbi:MAG: Com family DNA-binding transcriptional regulator [Candidatus Pacebacteria bacterium]|nr:Com family DNA-binding transcriptional regulator [Candidatus Paceibacterota bacterium]